MSPLRTFPHVTGCRMRPSLTTTATWLRVGFLDFGDWAALSRLLIPPFTAAADAAGESKGDELEEVIHLTNARVVMGEWLPFGPNRLAALNYRLGSLERSQGNAYLSSLLDDGKETTQCAISAGMTALRVLDFVLAQHVNAEASIDVGFFRWR